MSGQQPFGGREKMKPPDSMPPWQQWAMIAWGVVMAGLVGLMIWTGGHRLVIPWM